MPINFSGNTALAGTYNDSVIINGHALVTNDVIIRGDLNVSGNLTGAGHHSLVIEGTLIVHGSFNPSSFDLVVEGQILKQQIEWPQNQGPGFLFNDGTGELAWSIPDEQVGTKFSAVPGSVNTTDATPANVQVVSIANDSSILVRARVIGIRTGGSAGSPQDTVSAILTALVKNVSGSVTVYSVQTDYDFADQETWSVDIVAGSGQFAVQVTGAANNNVSWNSITEIHKS